MAESIDIRDGRYAANEAAYRRVNEHLRSYKERADSREPMTFMCECAEGSCIDPIPVGLDEYREVRHHARRATITGRPSRPTRHAETMGRHRLRFGAASIPGGRWSV